MTGAYFSCIKLQLQVIWGHILAYSLYQNIKHLLQDNATGKKKKYIMRYELCAKKDVLHFSSNKLDGGHVRSISVKFLTVKLPFST